MSAPDLTDLLRRRAWVTITNPVVGGSWSGHVIAHHDDPGVVIEQADGMRLCLPQSFTITEEDEPAQTLAEASEAMLPAVGEPPLPGGEYARVEIMGHDEHTGWVTESTRAGQPVMVVRDWDGFVIAEVPGHSLYRFVPLATPLKRPDAAAETRRALPAGAAHDVHDGFGDRGDWAGDGPW